MMNKIKNTYYAIVNGIRNILYWLPIVWRDQQWDYAFMLTIMQHKLSSMDEFFRGKHAVTLNHLEVAAEIRHVEACVSRLLKCEYFDVALEDCEDSWGIPSMSFVSRDGSRQFVGLAFPKARTDAQQMSARDEYGLALKEADAAELRDWITVWDTIREYGRGWWD